MVLGAESEDQECGTQTTVSAALVSSWTTVANRMRGPHQRAETETRDAALLVSRIPRHAALGRAQCDCRQRDADRALSRSAGNMNRNTLSALLVEPRETKVNVGNARAFLEHRLNAIYALEPGKPLWIRHESDYR